MPGGRQFANRDLAEAVSLLKECIEPMRDNCQYDHNGNCQEHFLHEAPCPYARAKEFLAKLESNNGGKTGE